LLGHTKFLFLNLNSSTNFRAPGGLQKQTSFFLFLVYGRIRFPLLAFHPIGVFLKFKTFNSNSSAELTIFFLSPKFSLETFLIGDDAPELWTS